MPPKQPLTPSAVLLPAGALCFNLFLMLFPGETLTAAREALLLWFRNVLPSLLPFMVGINLLMGLGAAQFLSVLLDSLMRSLFNIGGGGGFALAAGLMSGYPVGAKVTAEMYGRGNLSAKEAQRLAALASNAGPLFILGAVASGMFANAAAGWFLAAAHYGGAAVTAVLYRITTRKTKPGRPKVAPTGIAKSALHAMDKARQRDARPFGAILAQSVTDAVETLLLIGGYITVFGVVVRVMGLLGVPALLDWLLQALSLPEGLAHTILAGLLEMTNGARLASEYGVSRTGLVAAAAILSWGGLCVHAQAISFLSRAGLKGAPYLFAKLLHAICAAAVGYLVYPFFVPMLVENTAVLAFATVSPLGMFLRSAELLAAAVGLPLLCVAVWWTGRRFFSQKLFTRRKKYGRMVGK